MSSCLRLAITRRASAVARATLNQARAKADISASPQPLSTVEAMNAWGQQCQSVTKSMESSMPIFTPSPGEAAAISGKMPKAWMPEFNGAFGMKIRNAVENNPMMAAREKMLKDAAVDQMIRGLCLFFTAGYCGYQIERQGFWP